MADQITASNDLKPFAVAPEGQHIGVCVDVVDLGEAIDQYLQQPARVVQKAAIVFQIGEVNPDTGKRFEVSIEKTVSFGEKAGLRKFLTGWRGRSYTAEEALAGVPLHKLVNNCAVLSIENTTSAAGRKYAKILSAAPLMKGLPTLAALDYTRNEYWTKKREAYAAEVAVFRAANAKPERPIAEVLSDAEEDSALPF